jgi:hypothetical protein
VRAAELLLAGYLGGIVCYLGVLLTPTRPRAVDVTWALWAVLLALVWPASIVLSHEWASSRAASSRGRP